jgi:rSAM/selenodomain-associated transferase 1
MKRAIGVLARAPLPGRCKTRLLAAHGAEWIAELYAAMLRDTLDGLQSVTADEYVVFVAPVPPGPGEEDDADARTKLAFDVLARHVPAPWELIAQQGEDRGARVDHAFGVLFERGAAYALLSGSDAPSFPTEPLADAFADDALATKREVLVGPTDDGGYYAIGMSRLEPRLVRDIPWSTPAVMETTRFRCRELGVTLRELPRWYAVDEPSDVMKLLDEVRKHPERAPRTAQFFARNA